jgi:hypothetical protein
MKWITREHVKVDRVACPWLIRRFVDREAEFVFVPAPEVAAQARALGLSDPDTLDREFIVYDALYAECRRRAAAGR